MSAARERRRRGGGGDSGSGSGGSGSSGESSDGGSSGGLTAASKGDGSANHSPLLVVDYYGHVWGMAPSGEPARCSRC